MDDHRSIPKLDQDDAEIGPPKIGETPVREVLHTGRSALDRAVQRVVNDLERPQEQYSAFGSIL
jgi:hypothetical protein